MKIAIDSVSVGDKRPLFNKVITIEVACNQDGSFKRGWHPKGPGQWFVNHIEKGKYVIFHNLNTLSYATSFRIVGVGSVEVIKASDINIEINTAQNGEPADLDFHFCLSVMVENARR